MALGSLDVLFTPTELGPKTARNRLAMLPMGTRFPVDGLLTDRDNAWHEARAAGGVGLIITGGTVVSSGSAVRERINVEGWRRDNLERMRDKAEAVHAHGALLVAQLLHLGRETAGGQLAGFQVAPSAIRAAGQLFTPAELSVGGYRGS